MKTTLDSLLKSLNGKRYFWQGGGCFTLNPSNAKVYSNWELANYWCGRIRRWNLKFCSLEDLNELY